MSQNARKQGSCNAIFSSSPFTFNKENKPPKVLPGCSSYPDLTENQAMDQIFKMSKSKSTILDTFNSKKSTESNSQMRSNNGDNVTPQTSSDRSKSTTNCHRAATQLPQKSIADEKSKTVSSSRGTPRSTNDKTPVTHFCNTRRASATKMPSSTSGTPFRTPKRFFSDHINAQSTPECFGAVQFETPKGKVENGVDEQTIYEGESSNLTVGVRVRPMNLKELSESKVTSIVQVDGSNVVVDCESSQHKFTYDHCFISRADTCSPRHSSQEKVFRTMVLPLVQNAFEGYNVCLFAYGQTGSGKSHSMMGSETSQGSSSGLSGDAGIIPRFCREIFSQAAQNRNITTTVEISYFEIYNEKIHDLLASNTNPAGKKTAPLKVREHPVDGPYVVDLSQHSVQSYEDLQVWLKVGNSQRATAATGMNEKSSRSHSIFSIILTQAQKNDHGNKSANVELSKRSKINLVDLAGSERLSQTCASGNRLREGVSINKSLLILGKVIGSLAESTSNRKRGFVPYRESVLTWLLKESLGGNSKTAMLATVSPSSLHLEETLATLRYACQARSIVNRVRINEDPHDKLIRELKAEVQRLRGVREGYERQLGPRRLLDDVDLHSDNSHEVRNKQREIERLRDQLKRTEEQLALSQKSWSDKLREAEDHKNSELRFLRRCGIAIELDFEKNSGPCLVNLAPDPMLSGTLLYLIPPGFVRIRRQNSKKEKQIDSVDILLDGPLISPLHCTIENNNGHLTLTPEGNGDTYVNGQIVCEKVFLKNGDRLVVGGNHYFKVCHPKDPNSHQPAQPVDYEFAHQEILAIQEEKLRTELEESKQKAIKELEVAKQEVEKQLGSQKNDYEREIKILGSTLQQQKEALEEINKRKRELEIEKEILAHQIEESNKKQKEPVNDIVVSPYESHFLQDLKKLLADTTADAEIALSMALSKEAITEGGISLHEMQLLVREATERCRDIGLNYEFLQQRVVVEKDLEPAIRVRDKDRMLETLWKPMHFLDWIHRLRDFDNEDTIKELLNSEDNWEVFESDSTIIEDSLDMSRISINLTPVKKQLNESLHQLSMNSSFLDATADQTTDSTIAKRHEDMHACLMQMELATKTLGKLCHQYESRETSGEVTRSLDKVKSLINTLWNVLDSKHPKNDEDSHESGSNTTVIENSVKNSEEKEKQPEYIQRLQEPLRSPGKYSSRCPFFQENPPKSVRFNVQ